MLFVGWWSGLVVWNPGDLTWFTDLCDGWKRFKPESCIHNFILTYFIIGKSKLRILYTFSKKFRNWQWIWDGDTANSHHFGVSLKHSPYLCVFFLWCCPRFGFVKVPSPTQLEPRKSKRWEKQSKRVCRRPGRVEYHCRFGKNQKWKRRPWRLMALFWDNDWVSEFEVVAFNGCSFLLVMVYVFKAYYNLDLAPAGHCISSAISTYTQWYCFFYKKYVCGHNLV